MRYLEYKEHRKHGTKDFPFAFYSITSAHPRYYMTYHWHNEYELIYILEGSFCLTVNEQEFNLHPKDTAFIESGILHGGTPEYCRYVCLVFDLEDFLSTQSWAADIYRDLASFRLHINPCLPGDREEFHSCMEEICNAFLSKKPGYRFSVVGSLYRLLGLIIREGLHSDQSSTTPAQQKKITQLKSVLSFIARHYSEDISLNDLAACAGMNSNYFCKAFKSLTHQTPIGYLNYYRIESACELLATTSKSITDIALSCGFQDSSYFVKVFKKQKGVTPSHYLEIRP